MHLFLLLLLRPFSDSQQLYIESSPSIFLGRFGDRQLLLQGGGHVRGPVDAELLGDGRRRLVAAACCCCWKAVIIVVVLPELADHLLLVLQWEQHPVAGFQSAGVRAFIRNR